MVIAMTQDTPRKKKRSQGLNLVGMVKKNAALPLYAFAACLTLSGCGTDSEEAYLYSSVDECIDAHPGKEEICRSGYENAEWAALESGPRYASESLCEMEFGDGQCQSQDGGSFWMPLITGFIISEIIDEVGDYFEYQRKHKRSRDYYSTPVFFSKKSSNYGYYGLNEQKLGSSYKRNVAVDYGAFTKKPAKTYTSRTVRRGGFGTTMGKSYSSGSKKSWGG